MTEYTNGNHTSTTVINDKNIALDYYFNREGFTTAIFERRNPNSANDLMTLTKDGGELILDNSESANTEKINNQKVLTIPVGGLKYAPNHFLDYSTIPFLRKIHSFRYTNEKVKNYVFSFWMRHQGYFTSDCKAKISIETFNTNDPFYEQPTYSFERYIDKSAGNAWQYITVPVKLTLPFAVSYFKLEFTGCTGNIDIANLRMDSGPSTNYYISNNGNSYDKLINDPNKYKLEDFTKIKLTRNDFEYADQAVSQDIFLTESDIIQTLKNKSASADSKFDLVYCGGTKRYAKVSDIKLGSNNFSGYKFLALDNNISNKSVRANFYMQNDSPDDKGYSYTFYEFSDHIQYGKTICQSVLIKPDGKPQQQIASDFKGRFIEKTDAYDVKTTYSYANYGNPLSAEMQNTGGGEKLTHAYTHLKTEEQREMPEMQTSNNVLSVSTFNEPFMLPKTARTFTLKGYSKHFAYDDFNRLASVTAMSGIIENAKNILLYDDLGRIEKLQDNEDFHYNIEYDKFSTPSKFSAKRFIDGKEEEKVFLTKNQADSGENIIASEKIYHDYSNNICDISEHTIDKYGRIKTVKENGSLKAEHTYQELSESPSIAKTTLITDHNDTAGGTAAQYKYAYDSQNRPISYERTDGCAPLKVRQTANNKTRYSFSNNDIESEVIFDENVSVDPRILQTKYKVKKSSDADVENKWTNQKEFDINYVYDDLGRLKDKNNSSKIIENNINPKVIITDNNHSVNENFVYRDFSSHIKQNTIEDYYNYRVSIPSMYFIDFTYEIAKTNLEYNYQYDLAGNVLKVHEIKNVGSASGLGVRTAPPAILPTTTTEKTKSYIYDKLNRVETETVKEKISSNKDFELDYLNTYSYNKYGRLEKIVHEYPVGGSIVERKKEFFYDNFGRLTDITEEFGADLSCKYNDYGNLIDLNGIKYGWTGRLLTSLVNHNGTSKFQYDHQGRLLKRTYYNGATKTYFYDGDRLLGEDWSNGTKLRFFYDASGIMGFSHNNSTYRYAKDALGNITHILQAGEIVAEYFYDAFGNTTFYPQSGVAGVNPFRWKGYYYIDQVGFYIIGDRLYAPELYGYASAADPENLISNAGHIFGLNRYLLSTNNCIAFMAAVYSIFSSSALYADPDYKPDFDWRKFFKNFILTLLMAIGIITALMNPAAFIIGQLVAAGFAITGAVIGGIVTSAQGKSFWEGAAIGAQIGYIVGMIVYTVVSIVQAVRAASRAANVANVADDVAMNKPASTVETQVEVVQVKTPELTKPTVENKTLQNHIDELYKGINSPNRTGNGTTMDAIRTERTIGNQVGGKFHTIKGTERLNGINKLLDWGKMSYYDNLVARSIVDDLLDALYGSLI